LEANVGCEALQRVAGESLATFCHFLWKKVAKELSPPQTHGMSDAG
jgi:hypothetical protein